MTFSKRKNRFIQPKKGYLLVQQVREKNDKFQQRRLDSFFKASLQEGAAAGADEEEAAEAEEQAVPLEVMAM